MPAELQAHNGSWSQTDMVISERIQQKLSTNFASLVMWFQLWLTWSTKVSHGNPLIDNLLQSRYCLKIITVQHIHTRPYLFSHFLCCFLSENAVRYFTISSGSSSCALFTLGRHWCLQCSFQPLSKQEVPPPLREQKFCPWADENQRKQGRQKIKTVTIHTDILWQSNFL